MFKQAKNILLVEKKDIFMAGHEPFNPVKDLNFVTNLDQQYQVEATAQEITTHESEHVLKIPVIKYALELLPSGEFGMYGKTMKEMVDVGEPGGKESLESLQTIAKRFVEDPSVVTATFHSRDIGYGRDYVYVFENIGNGKISALAIEYNGSENERQQLQQLIGKRERINPQSFHDLYSPVFLTQSLELDDFVTMVNLSFSEQTQNDNHQAYLERLTNFVDNQTQAFEEQLSKTISRVDSMQSKLKGGVDNQEIIKVIRQEMEKYTNQNRDGVSENIFTYQVSNTGDQLITEPNIARRQFETVTFLPQESFTKPNIELVQVEKDIQKKVDTLIELFRKVNIKLGDKGLQSDYQNAVSSDLIGGLQNNLLERLQRKFRPITQNSDTLNLYTSVSKPQEAQDKQLFNSNGNLQDLVKLRMYSQNELIEAVSALDKTQTKLLLQLLDLLISNSPSEKLLEVNSSFRSDENILTESIPETFTDKHSVKSKFDLLSKLLHKNNTDKVVLDPKLETEITELLKLLQKTINNQTGELLMQENLDLTAIKYENNLLSVFKNLKTLFDHLYDGDNIHLPQYKNPLTKQFLIQNLKIFTPKEVVVTENYLMNTIFFRLQKMLQNNEVSKSELDKLVQLRSLLQIFQECRELLLKLNILKAPTENLKLKQKGLSLINWCALRLVISMVEHSKYELNKVQVTKIGDSSPQNFGENFLLRKNAIVYLKE